MKTSLMYVFLLTSFTQPTDNVNLRFRYKMSYYNYNSLFPAGQAQDRVRGVKMPAEGPKLHVLEEAFTSENWIVRIYKVKDSDNFGRDHFSAVAYEQGKKKKTAGTRAGKRGPRVLRVE